MGPPEALSLRQVCLKTLRRHLSLDTALPLLEFAREWDLPDSPYIESECMCFIKSTFPALLQREGGPRLEDVLGHDMVDAMLADINEVERWKQRKASFVGVVASPSEERGSTQPDPIDGGDSDSGTRPCYPFESLRRGAAWPPGIVPTQRETYLSAEEFATAFRGLSVEEFDRLPLWRRRLLKQAADLH